ncbi:MAG: aminopeptidase P family protein [Acholeplasmataceae bacterium]|nr:aminopeptidase P family protein [Acholeplasmataceae bacterium]
MTDTRRQTYFKHVPSQTISLFFSGIAPVRSTDQSYPFSVNRNFFYLSGIDQENAVLMMIKGAAETQTLLFINKPDPQKALWDGETLSFEDAAKIASLSESDVRDIETLDETLNGLFSSGRKAIHGLIDTVYIDLSRQKSTSPKTVAEHFTTTLRDRYPHLQIKPSQGILATLRMVKDAQEIETIKRAIRVTRDGLINVMTVLEEGMHEYEAEAVFNYILNKNRMRPGFETIAASGKNATVLHYVSNDSKIQKGDCVLFDLGAEHNQYNADITRVYPASGTFTKRQKEIYNVVLEANKKTIEWVKAGISYKDFLDYGKQILIDGAKRLGLIKEDAEINRYYYHSLGHYLGLDVHDVGDVTKPIPEGAVLTVEPGLYIAEEGIGIRIEDDILITKDGAINLSEDIPKETKDIEEIMKKQ